MEVFSTLPRTLVPWTTNVLTLGVLVAATWWSADQRPLAEPASDFKLVAAADSSAVPGESNERAKPAAPAARQVDAGARWQLTNGVKTQSVQPVAYQPSHRP